MFKLSEHYDQLVGMIIRPPRFTYHIDDLGPKHFIIGRKAVKRTDFELVNARGLAIQCSHFEPLEDWGHPVPCVVYLHGNGGGRLDALDVVRALLPCDISVMAIDFTGSGLSDGDYVSLGYWEKDDVATVVAHLRETGRVTSIGLWGRSMGAVTALLYARSDPSVAAMVLDSPFCSLQRVAEDLVCSIATLQRIPRLTKFAVGIGLRAIRNSIKKKAKFDLKTLEVLEMAKECFIPSLFVHGEYDTFVKPAHSEELYVRYGGDKNRIVVDGDHNSIRPKFFMDSAVIFLNNALYNGLAPPPPNIPPHNATYVEEDDIELFVHSDEMISMESYESELTSSSNSINRVAQSEVTTTTTAAATTTTTTTTSTTTTTATQLSSLTMPPATA